MTAYGLADRIEVGHTVGLLSDDAVSTDLCVGCGHGAANAAAGTGHQDTLAFDQPPHGVPVQGGLRPAEKVLDYHWLDVKFVGDSALEIG